ncbi:MAG: PhzF family phenazine biosynthesis protein [Sphingomonadaceae bacterium]
MTRNRAFKQVDVFTSVPLLGNPVAVILDAAGLDDVAMQRIANWTNLSETTFVLPARDPAADYAVRIFTPRCELPFAGHPTLGTAHAVVEAGIAAPTAGLLVIECAVGLVDVTVSADGLSFRLPRYSLAEADTPDELIAAIGGAALLAKPPATVDVGPRWMIAELVSADAVEQLAVNLPALAAYNERTATTGLTVFAAKGDGIVVRSFAPTDGLVEDPVCGSGNGAVAAFRLLNGAIGDGAAYVASQGRQMGRDGYVNVRIDGGDIHVGGSCVTCIDGVFKL